MKQQPTTLERTVCIKMRNTNDNKKSNFRLVNSSDNNNSSSEPKDPNVLRRIFYNPDKLWNFINGSLAAAIIMAIVGGALNLYKINKSLEDMAKKTDTIIIEDRISSLNEKFDKEYNSFENKLEKYDDKFNDLRVQVDVLQATNNTYKSIAQPAFQNSVLNMCQKDSLISIDNALWQNSDIIAINPTTHEKFTVSELSGEKLLFSYIQNGQEIFFYGQYSENRKWDGNCIINVYDNDKLQLITEATYDDGILLNYRQAYTYTTIANEEVWCISKRECTDLGNMGDSWNYYKEKDIVKHFTLDEVEPTDILNVGQISEEIETSIEGFYHGITSEGQYNDMTGEAYLIKFSKKDGTVRTLYVGNFTNGSFSDDTGNAWYITRDDTTINGAYMYYIGKFKNGTPIDKVTEDNSKTNLSYEDIIFKTETRFFKCELKWYGFDSL